MPASTIEHSTIHQPNPVRSTGSTAIVRAIGGVHVPTAGPWGIGSAQRLGIETRGLRTRLVPARAVGGALIFTDDLLGSSFDFTMLVPGTSSCIGFSTEVTQLLSVDAWQADGTVTTAGGSRSVTLRLRYNGVFRQRGRPPCLWLALQTTIDLPELAGIVGSRRARRLKIAADLNLSPLSTAR